MKISLQNLRIAKELKLSQNIDDFSFIDDPDIFSLKIDFDIKLLTEKIVLVNGFFVVFMNKNCERCLEKFTYKLKVDFNKDYEIDENQTTLDFSDDMREEFWLNIPMVYLCKTVCKGLCDICGNNLNLKECDCKKQENDFNKSKLNDSKNNPFTVLKIFKQKE